MPKRIREVQDSKLSTTEQLTQHLKKLLRREVLIHYPSESSTPIEQNLRVLIASIEAGQTIRLTQRELPPGTSLPGEAYLFDPKTTTYTEMRN